MRKPQDKQGPLESREAVWQAIRRLTAFTIADLFGELNVDKNTIGLYVRSLVKAGYLQRMQRRGQALDFDTGPRESVSKSRPDPMTPEKEDNGTFRTLYRYELVKDSLEAPRVRSDGSFVTQGRGRQNMWRSMQILKRFTLSDLVAGSSTEEHPISWAEAEHYTAYLARAGYLKKAGRGMTSSYLLVRNTGPKAPMIQRIRQVWDQNLKKVVWPAPAKETGVRSEEFGVRRKEGTEQGR